MAAKKKTVKNPRVKAKAKGKGKGKGGSGAPAPAPSGGFVFAEQKQTPDDFSGFSKQDVLADSSIRGLTTLEPFPASRKPEVLSLDQVLGAAEIAKIKAAGQIVFHSVGDTGGIKEPSKQFAVADAMANDLSGKTYQAGRPAFFYH